jgi:hypothetical protein
VSRAIAHPYGEHPPFVLKKRDDVVVGRGWVEEPDAGRRDG